MAPVKQQFPLAPLHPAQPHLFFIATVAVRPELTSIEEGSTGMRPPVQVVAKLTDPEGQLYPLSEARQRVSDLLERAYLEELLARARGNVGAAAQLAGVTRQYLGRVIARHGLGRTDEPG